MCGANEQGKRHFLKSLLFHDAFGLKLSVSGYVSDRGISPLSIQPAIGSSSLGPFLTESLAPTCSAAIDDGHLTWVELDSYSRTNRYDKATVVNLISPVTI
jgi:hypothetical protein